MVTIHILHILRLDSLQILQILNYLCTTIQFCGSICIDCFIFFTIIKYNHIQGHEYKLYKQQCQLDVCKYCFAHKVVDLWKDLPCYIVNADAVNSFKY